MTALEEILNWSESAPTWLRDALRRIVTASEVSDDDFVDLVELCKVGRGLGTRSIAPDVLSRHHLPVAPRSGAVSIASITHVADVNALAPNATLAFAPTGLTIIYGDNGAGKSGFTRILRRACRARGGNDPILANAFSGKAAGPPTAKIDYAIAGAARSHIWKDGTPADAELSAVSVFDTASAQVYVEAKTEVRFRPFGLDVTDRAAAACLRVKKTLDAEVAALEAGVVELPALAPATEAGRLIAGLSALTLHAEVDRVGTLNADEHKELDALTELLAAARAEDPTKRAVELKHKAGRFRRLLVELRELEIALADTRLEKVIELAAEASIAADDARRFTESFATELSLPGVGGPEWGVMWDGARTYAETLGYPGRAFPCVSDGARCVLCQQELQAAAQERMQRFAELVLGAAREAAHRKKAEADEARRAIAELRPGERNKDALAELEGTHRETAAGVDAFLTSAKECCADIVATVPAPRRCSAAVPLAELEAVIADLERRSDAFVRAADPAERARSEQRVAELGARQTLGASLADMHGEIDRLARLNAYDLCLKDTDTRALTKLGVELTKKYVTDALTAAFSNELTTLGLETLELELKPAGQRGQLFHKIQLKHGSSTALQEIASEGESRCIALAAFMAELHGAGHDSAIVFDDPVSSLGHRWRSRVAQRLVQAAQTRQVVVFTHELVFLAALLQEADKVDVPAETRTVTRDREYAGHVAKGLPWHGLSTKKRISLLRERWVVAEKAFRTSGQDAYDPIATLIYADVRRTWERAVEEVLLNQVVLRFRAGIETHRLKEIGDITADDLTAVDRGMTKSSKWEGGHDQALAMNERLPPPAELKIDIEALDAWVTAVVSRRK